MRLTILWVVLFCAVLVAADKPPACNSKTRGQFWPQAANSDPARARAAAQTGELRLCTRQGFRFGWREVTVHWTDLRKKTTGSPSAD